MYATTLQEALTAIAEQDSNLKLIKWAVKVRNTPFLNHQKLWASQAMKYGEKKGRRKRLRQLAGKETWATTWCNVSQLRQVAVTVAVHDWIADLQI